MKIIKYLINIAAALFLIWCVYVSFALIARIPTPDQIMNIIISVLNNFVVFLLIYIAIIFIFNFIFERKVEKEKVSRKFIWITLSHVIVFIFSFIIFAYNFHNYCVNNQPQEVYLENASR